MFLSRYLDRRTRRAEQEELAHRFVAQTKPAREDQVKAGAAFQSWPEV